MRTKLYNTETLRKNGPPQELISCVNAFIMARMIAEVETEKVDAIQREVIATADYWPDKADCKKYGDKYAPIKDIKRSYRLGDDEFISYISDVRKALENAGYEIKDIPGEGYHSYFCPALTKQHLQTGCEWLLIEAGARMIGYENPKDMNCELLCLTSNGKSGIENRRAFIDLLCGLVINWPGYVNPLNSKEVTS